MKKLIIVLSIILLAFSVALANSPGTLKWESKTDGAMITIFLVFGVALANSPGTLKWKFKTDGLVKSSPAIGKDGTIYVGSEDKYVYAINPDGTLKWKFLTDGSVYSSPAIGEDGTIYVGSYDGNLYAIYSDSKGLADSPWPKFRANNMNTGRVGQ